MRGNDRDSQMIQHGTCLGTISGEVTRSLFASGGGYLPSRAEGQSHAREMEEMSCARGCASFFGLQY